MGNLMQSYVPRQPEALQGVLDRRQKNIGAFLTRYGSSAFARIIMIGAGSSFHALNMARPFCQKAMGVPVFACTPAQLGWLTPSMAADTLVLAASQSGTSTNVLKAVRQLRKSGFAIAAITQAPLSPIAQEADVHVLLDIPEEKTGPKTMGVSATVLTAQLMMGELAQSLDAFQKADMASFYADMQSIIKVMPENIDAAIGWCERRKRAFLSSSSYLVVAQGDNASIAGECALKLIETVRVPAIGFELEEIIHGPAWVLHSGVSLVYLGTPWEDGTRPAALCDLCGSRGGESCRVSLCAEKPYESDQALMLNSCANPLLSAYALLLPAQVMSAWLPPAMGIDLDAKSVNPYASILAGHL